MAIVVMLLEAVAMIVGSLVAGALFCWLCWHLAKVVGHPAWGSPIVAFPILLAVTGHLPASQFLDMTLAFAAISAIPFWIEGRAWRRRRIDRSRSNESLSQSPPSAAPCNDPASRESSSCLYPAITACIRDARPAAPKEIKLVASRIWRESFTEPHATPSFALRKTMVRAARQALEGSG